MTTSLINFPGPDSYEAPNTLKNAFANSLNLLGSIPKMGLLLKVKDSDHDEIVVHWGLVDPMHIMPQPLREALAANHQPVVLIGAFPSTGIILKVKEDEAGERLVNWTLADPTQIEMLAIGLSVMPPETPQYP